MTWETVKLGDIGKISTGNTPSKKETGYYAGGNIAFIKPNNFDKNIISDLSVSDEYLTKTGSAKSRTVPKDTTLVTCIGTIGNVGITSKQLCFNQQINAIEPHPDKCISRFLAYSIIYMRKKLQAMANAPVVPIINKNRFSSAIPGYGLKPHGPGCF